MTQVGTKKSRKGCTQCKKRRVKCNEQTPCANCARRGEQCSLIRSLKGFEQNDVLDLGLPRSSTEWLEDLELMHHYNNREDLIPQFMKDSQFPYTDNISKELLKRPVPMHAMLALSALHLAQEQPWQSEKCLRLCERHHTKAVELLQAESRVILSPETRPTSYTTSVVASTLSMARSCIDATMMPAPPFISMEQVADLCTLTRGVRTLPVVESTSSLDITASHLPPSILEPRHTLERVSSLPQHLQMQFLGLNLMLEDFCTPAHLRECGPALERLQKVYCDINELGDESDRTQVSWHWMATLSTEFVTLIEVCYPPALVILAHFTVATMTSITSPGIRRARTAWFMAGWGDHVLTGVSLALLGNEWHQWLEWPLEMARHGVNSEIWNATD